MKKNPGAFVALYRKLNRNGFNALAGALESEFGPNCPELVFAESAADAASACQDLLARGLRVVAGLSFFSSQLEETAAALAVLRGRLGGRIILAAGGPHASARPQDCIELGFDLVFVGEAEDSFCELFARIRDGGSLDGIPMTYSTAGPAGPAAERRPVELDRYSPLPLAHKRYGPLEITRGCPHACRYCQTSRLFGAEVRHRSVDVLANWAAVLRSRGLRDLRLLSPDAFAYGSPDGRALAYGAIEELLARLRLAFAPPGKLHFGYFPSELRPEHVTEGTLELLTRFTDTRTLVIGAQTGSPAVLAACRRGHSLEDVLRAVGLSRAFGLEVLVDFIFGLPAEGEAEARESLAFMEELLGMGARVHPHAFLPLPGTPWESEPAGPLAPFIREALTAAAKRKPGAVFGDWGVQVKRGIRLAGRNAG